MSRYNRTKGHSFERQIAAELRTIGWPDCITTRQARGGNWEHTDDGRDLVRTPGLAIQCKRLKEYAPVSTIEEIIDYPKENEMRLVLTKANGRPIMAILPWEDLKKFIAKDSLR